MSSFEALFVSIFFLSIVPSISTISCFLFLGLQLLQVEGVFLTGDGRPYTNKPCECWWPVLSPRQR